MNNPHLVSLLSTLSTFSLIHNQQLSFDHSHSHDQSLRGNIWSQDSSPASRLQKLPTNNSYGDWINLGIHCGIQLCFMGPLWMEYTHFVGSLLLWDHSTIHAAGANVCPEYCRIGNIYLYFARIFRCQYVVLICRIIKRSALGWKKRASTTPRHPNQHQSTRRNSGRKFNASVYRKRAVSNNFHQELSLVVASWASWVI